MIEAKPTDTVADLAARIREEREACPRNGWMYTPEEAAERMIWAAKEKERLERYAASVGMDLDSPEAQAEHARRVEAGTPPNLRPAFIAQRARVIEAARAALAADETEYTEAVTALSAELVKLTALDPGPWHYRCGQGPGQVEPVRGPRAGISMRDWLETEALVSTNPLDGLSPYELGRARGACYGRTEPTQRDEEWLREVFRADGESEPTEEDYGEFVAGMLDGAEQAQAARLGLAGIAPPSAEVIAAAADPKR